MPFGRYVSVAPALPTDPNQRLRELFRIHTLLKIQYGERYREINGILSMARGWAESDPAPGEPAGAARSQIVVDINQVRTDTVLFFKTTIDRAEFLINELRPGTFPVGDPTDDNGPLQSVDIDELFQLGAAIGVLGAAITAGGAPQVGVPVAAFGAGFMAGAAIAGMLWD